MCHIQILPPDKEHVIEAIAKQHVKIVKHSQLNKQSNETSQ